ncbi:MAG: HAD hydrolase family protein, partial [Eubacterium sp.]|nr:HAD hydrolase family protein [Eubacterium sp.]
MIRLVVSSLENIIELNDNREVGEDILDLIVRLKEKDIKFAIATSQNYDSVKDIFGRLKNDIIYICNDGGVVVYQGKVISKTPID